jgi:hypothetical protein
MTTASCTWPSPFGGLVAARRAGAAVAPPPVGLVRAAARFAGAFLVVDLAAVAFEVVAFGAGVFAFAGFDPAACVFAFFAGALAVRALFLGAPAGGVVSGAVTRAS